MEIAKAHEHEPENARIAEAVRTGDETAFGALTSGHRAELRVHCYRMLGSLTDAEDLVQETFLKAWRARETFAGRATVRAWLYRIATNACLDFLEANKSRRWGAVVTSAEPEPGSLPHVPWLEPYPDRMLDSADALAPGPEARLVSRETIELAFMVAIQCLPAKQRAALILCDVLDWSAREAGELLSMSAQAVNAALQRARETMRDQQVTGVRARSGRSPTDEEERKLLTDYVSATERCDMAALAATLREDVRFRMPPEPVRMVGRDACVAAWVEGGLGSPDCRDFRCLLTRCNRQPAVAIYRRKPSAPNYEAFALDVLELSEGLVADIVCFVLTGGREDGGSSAGPLVARFGLPAVL
jgi:RNA polymerase sigma-70 factor, ECF subfamily